MVDTTEGITHIVDAKEGMGLGVGGCWDVDVPVAHLVQRLER